MNTEFSFLQNLIGKLLTQPVNANIARAIIEEAGKLDEEHHTIRLIDLIRGVVGASPDFAKYGPQVSMLGAFADMYSVATGQVAKPEVANG